MPRYLTVLSILVWPNGAGSRRLHEQGHAFEAAFGVPAPHPEDGPHLAGFTIGCRGLAHLASLDLPKVGGRYVVPPSRGFGTAIGFAELKGSS